jgi:hypothetical protein
MEFDLKNLVDFARKNHEQFQDFSDENIEKFFELYAKTIIIRQDKTTEKINGFCVWLSAGEKVIEIITICLVDKPENNRRDIRAFLYRWKSAGYKVIWSRETTGNNVFGLLADIYDFACNK